MIQIILMIRTIEKVLFENNNNFIKDLNIDEDKPKHEKIMTDTYNNEDKIINRSNSNQEYIKNNRKENNDINKINNKQSCEQKYSIL